MKNVPIKNIVFDIGNVMVKWSPMDIVKNTFGEQADINTWLKCIFASPTWFELNRGEVTEAQAIDIYLSTTSMTPEQAAMLFRQVKETQVLLGTHELLPRLQNNYQLFALTDNIHEVVHHLKQQYDFWDYFNGVVVSAEIGSMKPQPEIFQHLLNNYQLQATETLFIDDHLPNVIGAQAVGLHAFQFVGVDDCKQQLEKFGITTHII
jgi:putative hydrolase of the HAD superfamily